MHTADCDSLKRLIADATIPRAGRLVHERDNWDIELSRCTGCNTTHYGEWVEIDAIAHAPECRLVRRAHARACLATLGMPEKVFTALEGDETTHRLSALHEERSAFEQWARSAFAEFERSELRPLPIDHAFARHSADHPNAGEYVDPAIETAWYAWQGRAGVAA